LTGDPQIAEEAILRMPAGDWQRLDTALGPTADDRAMFDELQALIEADWGDE